MLGALASKCRCFVLHLIVTSIPLEHVCAEFSLHMADSSVDFSCMTVFLFHVDFEFEFK